MTRLALTATTVLALLLPAAVRAADCADPADPVLTLDFASRYETEDASRSTLDEARAEAARAAIDPLDDFIRALAERLETALSGDAEARAAAADCILAQMADWARADALSDLGTETVELTIGSRLAGFAIIAGALSESGGRAADRAAVIDWLDARMEAQMRFWEGAPPRAGQNNLRAWAALAGAATARLNDDPVTRGWAAWSAAYVLCGADEAGALPAEMTRGPLALHYQLHAVAPLVTAALLLDRQGIPLIDRCDGALRRVVAFTLSDLEDGAATEALAGAPQSFFTGEDEIERFHLAWLEAWLQLDPDPTIAALIDDLRPLSYSKLGGNQTLIWGR